MMLELTFILMTSLLLSTGNILQKMGNKGFDFEKLIKDRAWLTGCILAFLSFPVMILALNFMNISVLQPGSTLNLVLTLILGRLILGERLTTKEYVGILLMIVGVLCVVA
ncbi:hypothetical protein DRN62_01745 [Nanoarchaeota archaeon]|nr:MAG: hypothetical protein DRN62_01745 [Nanoarchaeota archaeon]